MGSRVRSGEKDAIARHREAISAIDETIVRLLARRVRLVLQVWEAKERSGRPLVDPEQEEVVWRRARVFAGRHGLDPDLAEEMIADIVAHGKRYALRRRRTPGGAAPPVKLKRGR